MRTTSPDFMSLRAFLVRSTGSGQFSPRASTSRSTFGMGSTGPASAGKATIISTRSAANAREQGAGRALVAERNGDEAAAGRDHFGRARRRLRGVIAALDQDVGPACGDELARRVVVERHVVNHERQ